MNTEDLHMEEFHALGHLPDVAQLSDSDRCSPAPSHHQANPHPLLMTRSSTSLEIELESL